VTEPLKAVTNNNKAHKGATIKVPGTKKGQVALRGKVCLSQNGAWHFLCEAGYDWPEFLLVETA